MKSFVHQMAQSCQTINSRVSGCSNTSAGGISRDLGLFVLTHLQCVLPQQSTMDWSQGLRPVDKHPE